jgi:tripartite-type tricarboxylate transporter receptor subunit TctC
VNQINVDFNKALQHSKVRKDMMDRGSDPGPIESDEDFARFLRLDLAKWGKHIRKKGISVSG